MISSPAISPTKIQDSSNLLEFMMKKRLKLPVCFLCTSN